MGSSPTSSVKWCYACESDKALKAFHKGSAVCKECRAVLDKYRRQERAVRDMELKVLRRERNRAILQELHRTQWCVDCGLQEPATKLEFHHRDPEQKVGAVPDLANAPVSEETLLAEIAKCDLLCGGRGGCHNHRHQSGELEGLEAAYRDHPLGK